MALLHLTKFNVRAYREDEGDAVTTSPVAVNADAIRCFYPRHGGQQGTRITFKDGGGFPVAESYEEIVAYVEEGTRPEPRQPILTATPESDTAH